MEYGSTKCTVQLRALSDVKNEKKKTQKNGVPNIYVNKGQIHYTRLTGQLWTDLQETSHSFLVRPGTFMSEVSKINLQKWDPMWMPLA